jgi:hypothetical protein
MRLLVCSDPLDSIRANWVDILTSTRGKLLGTAQRWRWLSPLCGVRVRWLRRRQVASRYLHLFLSCNSPLHNRTRWCARCSKCCFVQLLLSAWLEPAQVCSVFGDDLYEDTTLLPIYRVLLGLPDPEDR